MRIVNNHQAQTELVNGTAVIIDVREPAEYKHNHIPGALNLPFTKYEKDRFMLFENHKIYLVCESGKRAAKIKGKLNDDGFSAVAVLETQMQDIKPQTTNKGWSVDRQFRFTLGILLFIFLSLYFSGIQQGIVIPIILATGLTITAIIDRCYMRMGIAMLPWNRNKR